MPINNWKTSLLCGIGLIILSILFIDKPMAFYFEHAPPTLISFCNFVNVFTYPPTHILLWIVIYYFLRFPFRKLFIARKIMLIAITVNLTNALSFPIKMLFGRHRPDLLFSKNQYGFEFFSPFDFDLAFPSGHALVAASIFASLACFYPRFTWLFFGLAFLLSFCRVISSAHFFSDIVAGLIMGIFVVQYVFLSMEREIKFSKN